VTAGLKPRPSLLVVTNPEKNAILQGFSSAQRHALCEDSSGRGSSDMQASSLIN
jgi:hypothetical protein